VHQTWARVWGNRAPLAEHTPLAYTSLARLLLRTARHARACGAEHLSLAAGAASERGCIALHFAAAAAAAVAGLSPDTAAPLLPRKRGAGETAGEAGPPAVRIRAAAQRYKTLEVRAPHAGPAVRCVGANTAGPRPLVCAACGEV
jgi:hypothetical protein